MTPLHVVVILIGAVLAAYAIKTGHCVEAMPVAGMIISGAIGNATVNRQQVPPSAPVPPVAVEAKP